LTLYSYVISTIIIITYYLKFYKGF